MLKLSPLFIHYDVILCTIQSPHDKIIGTAKPKMQPDN